MTTPRFLQIHTLHSYPAALINRDESGFAKRMPFGGTVRTRISSQCLKRRWRTAEDEFALTAIEGVQDSIRSRNVVGRSVMAPLRSDGGASSIVLDAIEDAFNVGLYGNSGTSASGRQPLLVGQPEIEYLQHKARAICTQHPVDDEAAGNAATLLFSSARRNEERQNFAAFRKQTSLPGGLISALFGRMVTSDPNANIDAAVHVAHAFTVHSEETESDYFSVVDDLTEPEEQHSAAYIGDMELTAGLFYGYVVVDLPILVSNLSGSIELAGKVVEHLIHLIATVTPGAKLGSTAPYTYADLMLVEAGSRQPRTLANAFRASVDSQTTVAAAALSDHLGKLDACYGVSEVRCVMSVDPCNVPHAERLSLDELALWAGDAVRCGQV